MKKERLCHNKQLTVDMKRAIIQGLSLRETAKICEIHRNTAFNLRDLRREVTALYTDGLCVSQPILFC